ncbi:MAG: DUF192 domain-containing protein [SAR202 cluster bacterium]|nr:DUF192 domain-containing protein [SAR202 cluster bacterium]MDP6800286.1 DUF192 domain-containing protein [SAR202 cluster bacterium]
MAWFQSRSSLIGAVMILIGLTGILAVALFLRDDDQTEPPKPIASTPSAAAPATAPGTVREIQTLQRQAIDVQRVVSGEFSPNRMVINGHGFNIELAREANERSIGLSGRESVGVDAGMMFVFPNEGFHRFWMKGTLVPLDLIYIDAGGAIVSIQTMAPEPGVSDANLTLYEPPVIVSLAVEINGARAAETGLEEGMIIEFE